MKKLIGIKKINDTFTNAINELYANLENDLKDIKHEYQQNIIDEKIKLLITICNGENLDINEMKLKYLKPKEIENFEPINLNKNNISIDSNLLDKIIINGKDYYREVNGSDNYNIYDIDDQFIGVSKNGKIIFNT